MGHPGLVQLLKDVFKIPDSDCASLAFVLVFMA